MSFAALVSESIRTIVDGGNRTDAGAAAQSILVSVLATAAKLGRDAKQFASQTLRATAGSEPHLLSSG